MMCHFYWTKIVNKQTDEMQSTTLTNSLTTKYLWFVGYQRDVSNDEITGDCPSLIGKVRSTSLIVFLSIILSLFAECSRRDRSSVVEASLLSHYHVYCAPFVIDSLYRYHVFGSHCPEKELYGCTFGQL